MTQLIFVTYSDIVHGDTDVDCQVLNSSNNVFLV